MLVGCGEEEEEESMPSKLPLLSLFPFPVRSPGHEDASSGSSTPPFHSSASVPFKWEEEPGKPINRCTALIPFAQPLPCLHLIPPPSRRSTTTTTTPSPTTVLDGPPSPETGLLGPMVMMMSHSEQNKSITKKKKKKRLFGSWPWGSSRRTAANCKKMVVVGERDNNKGSGLGGSFVFSSSSSSTAAFSCSLDDVGRECCSECGGESECAAGEAAGVVKQMTKSRSFINFAQVMPWKVGSKTRKHGTSS